MGTEHLISRITIEEGKLGGKPCIRNMRISVADVLGMLAAGASQQDILESFSALEREDILACLAYGAEVTGSKAIAAE